MAPCAIPSCPQLLSVKSSSVILGPVPDYRGDVAGAEVVEQRADRLAGVIHGELQRGGIVERLGPDDSLAALEGNFQYGGNGEANVDVAALV